MAVLKIILVRRNYGLNLVLIAKYVDYNDNFYH
ncbi:hypothetical protein C8C84_0111 [Flavobacterium sp. 102]|nr:hypothetical protein C8C84_0111 [Flavobacterium sp. 102]